jgi:hypothetical protein
MSLESMRSTVCASVLMVIVPGLGMADFFNSSCQFDTCGFYFTTEWRPQLDDAFLGPGGTMIPGNHAVLACGFWKGDVEQLQDFRVAKQFQVSVGTKDHRMQHTTQCIGPGHDKDEQTSNVAGGFDSSTGYLLSAVPFTRPQVFVFTGKHPKEHIDKYAFSVEYNGPPTVGVNNPRIPGPINVLGCHIDPNDPKRPKLPYTVGTTNGKPSVTFTTEAANGVKELLVFLAFNVDLVYDVTGLKSVTAIKRDANKTGVVGLRITDQQGHCNLLDPVLTTIEIPPEGKLVRQTLTDIPQAESHITIKNNAPGLRRLIIQTNGRMAKLVTLETDTVTIDVSAAMVEGNNNTITLIGLGRPGASASILVAPPQSGPDEDEQGTAARQDPAGPEGRGGSLGPIALGWNVPNDEDSLSAMLSDGGVDASPSPELLGSPVSATARLSMNALRLTTNGHLGLDAASNPANYLVEVNGITSDVRIVGYQAGTNTVLLGLAPETLRQGDTVRVSSKDFGGQIGRALAGEVRTVVTK